ncbi:hypothetical protein KTH81_15075 [Lachnospiraceae bacterium ASD3451]|uniref:hypothetical protein n=1 Tax=Diplocloster agilis TaxID=2850323 RepID=UPI001D9DC364|nr:hypothetical protein [Diplocloster agilis]MBU9745144.1 hypothetical protein [Diplocloster agilis]DAE53266.1 MAG TPA: hypothetical protein [Caudoviricetes sp.]
MDGLRGALEYLVNLNNAYITDIKGETYTDKKLSRIDKELRAVPLNMSTLTSLVTYISSHADQFKGKLLVHIESPTEVKLLSCLDEDRKRECLVAVNAETPEFRYESYIDHESFLIALRSKFIKNEDRDLIIKFAGTVEAGSADTYGDDGISQKVTIRKGIAGKEDAIVPNPVKLQPYRTFKEVQQPLSEFVFRMRDRSGEIGCALFEADGGAWKTAAMESIHNYLVNELKIFPEVIVLH